MGGEWKSQIWPLLITGLLAILGTVAGGVIKGYWDTSLAERKFQSDLVMKALESDVESERIKSLKFMIETQLISDTEIRRGLDEYMKKHPGTVPHFRPAPQSFSQGIVVPYTQETMQFTDFDVFVCQESEQDEEAKKAADRVTDALKGAGSVGQIRRRTWDFYDEVSIDDLKDKLTIIYDEGHGETQELPRLRRIFREFGDLPPLQELPNQGEETGWIISIVLCPSR
jgi:hypothetical protein